jgi:hypothetical protein
VHARDEETPQKLANVQCVTCLLGGSLWDSYLCKTAHTVSLFHLCVCAAFLSTWSGRLRKFDFSEAVIFLQHLV